MVATALCSRFPNRGHSMICHRRFSVVICFADRLHFETTMVCPELYQFHSAITWQTRSRIAHDLSGAEVIALTRRSELSPAGDSTPWSISGDSEKGVRQEAPRTAVRPFLRDFCDQTVFWVGQFRWKRSIVTFVRFFSDSAKAMPHQEPYQDSYLESVGRDGSSEV